MTVNFKWPALFLLVLDACYTLLLNSYIQILSPVMMFSSRISACLFLKVYISFEILSLFLAHCSLSSVRIFMVEIWNVLHGKCKRNALFFNQRVKYETHLLEILKKLFGKKIKYIQAKYSLKLKYVLKVGQGTPISSFLTAAALQISQSCENGKSRSDHSVSHRLPLH